MLKNMKIRLRLTLVFVIIVIFSSVASVIGLFLMDRIDTDYSNALIDYGFLQGDLGNLGRHFQGQRVLIFQIITSYSESERQEHIQELYAIDKQIDDDLILIQKTLGSQDNQIFRSLSQALNDFKTQRNNIIKTNESLKGDSIVKIFEDNCTSYSDNVASIIDEIMLETSTKGHKKSTELSLQTDLFSILMIIIVIGSGITAIVLSVVISRGISKPIVEIENTALEMAKGNYDVLIHYESNDELGSLAKNMRQMLATTKSVIEDTSRVLSVIGQGNFDVSLNADYVGVYKNISDSITEITDSLSSVMLQIDQTSQQVASGAEQVSGGAQALSQGATEQASSIEELSATIMGISEQVNHNAQNAIRAKTQSESAGNEVVNCNQQMQEMIVAMEDISDKSAQISKIIKTIDDIAFQTNILALNAAVEAARAGSAGKGFAVVADEVRNLAGKSAEAVKNTTALIEQTLQAVGNGARIADSTAQSMVNVVNGTRTVINLIVEISIASNEQANSITQVTMGVDQISSVIQTNSATSEQSAAASEELSGQAQMLKSLVEKFNLKTNDGGNTSFDKFDSLSKELNQQVYVTHSNSKY